MDDVWLPIMHSAMDPRSNRSLLTVTTDTLKESELSSDAELSTQSDMWQNRSFQGKWGTKWGTQFVLGHTMKVEEMNGFLWTGLLKESLLEDSAM